MANQQNTRSFEDAAGGTDKYDCGPVLSALQECDAPGDVPQILGRAIRTFYADHAGHMSPEVWQNVTLTAGVLSGNIGNRSGT